MKGMSNEQYLLNKLAEECNEVAQIALKTAQFGLSEMKPGQSLTNAQRIYEELNDVMGILKMLNDEVIDFDYEVDSDAAYLKILKVAEFRSYSQQLGMVEK